MSNIKINKKFQTAWQLYKDEHVGEGYELEQIKELYWPIWKCRQSIVVEKKLTLDRFSKILLELVDNGINQRSEICNFLGVVEDSFLAIHLHFLLKNDLLQEIEKMTYHLSSKGHDFLANKIELKQLEVLNFEYVMLEAPIPSKVNFKLVLLNLEKPIDAQIIAPPNVSFKGYRIQRQNFISKNDQALKITHNLKEQPSFAKLRKERNHFAEFFNAQFKNKCFYDFDSPSIRTSQHFIGFLALFYRSKENPKLIKVAVRQTPKSVRVFKTHVLEEKLSKKATQYFQRYPVS